MQRPFSCVSVTGEAEAEDEVSLVQATSQLTGRAGCGRSSFAASALALGCTLSSLGLCIYPRLASPVPVL